jgi:5-deoxy-glucuronate isomerase
MLEVTRLRIVHDDDVFDTGGDEVIVLPLAGSCTVTIDGETFDLDGRESVFSAVTDFVYVGRGSVVTLSSDEVAEVAIPAARCSTRLEPRYGAASDVPVESRGAGNASRQVTNFGVPGVWDHAEKLICCELITPPGNWSSYPPHKHEHDQEGESELEETYYYRLRDPENGWAVQRVYSPERDFDLTQTVHDGELLLIPWGYHTTVAAHGHDLYYLNVLAGPAPKRTLQAFQDPCLKATQDVWESVGLDSRLPLIPRYPDSQG